MRTRIKCATPTCKRTLFTRTSGRGSKHKYCSGCADARFRRRCRESARRYIKNHPERYRKGAYLTSFRSAFKIMGKESTPALLNLNELDKAIDAFIKLVQRNRPRAQKIIGMSSYPNDSRIIEGKTGLDTTMPKQFIAAALDEPRSLRYELFPTLADRTSKTNGSLFLSVWDVMRSFHDLSLLGKAVGRWLRYEKFIVTLKHKKFRG